MLVKKRSIVCFNQTYPLDAAAGTAGGGINMGKPYVKISIRVSPQTAFHLKNLASMDKCSEGRVIDKLVRDRVMSMRGREPG